MFLVLFCFVFFFSIKCNNTDPWPIRYRPYIFSRTSTNEPLYIYSGVQSIHWLLSTENNVPLFMHSWNCSCWTLSTTATARLRRVPNYLLKITSRLRFFSKWWKKSRMFVPINSSMIQVKLPLCLAKRVTDLAKAQNAWQLYFT